ncbi:hypothetical protein RhiTH_007328 [Rhizoctonia solani]
MHPEDVHPFTISVPDSDLAELQKKLELTRLPDEVDLPAGQEWDWGIPLAVLKPIVHYWREGYNWRAVEEKINRTLPQFTTTIESRNHGLRSVHFVFRKSNNSSAIPLLFIHGWPGSFLEVSKMIDELTNPSDPKHPAFHVVAPSLPNFTLSDRTSTTGMDLRETAFLFDKLMAKLRFKHYLAQGGDWYWIKGPAGGLRYYKENHAIHRADRAGPHAEIEFGWSSTPFAFSRFPKEISPVPLDWAGLRQNLVYAKSHDRGGHFAAWEVPELLSDDIRQFAKIVQERDERLRDKMYWGNTNRKAGTTKSVTENEDYDRDAYNTATFESVE